MEFVSPNLHMWLTFLVILGAIISYAWDKVSLEVTSIVTILLLLLLFEMAPLAHEGGRQMIGMRSLLAGFADPALIAIIALLIVGQALVQTGALDPVAQTLMAWGTRRPVLVIGGSNDRRCHTFSRP